MRCPHRLAALAAATLGVAAGCSEPPARAAAVAYDQAAVAAEAPLDAYCSAAAAMASPAACQAALQAYGPAMSAALTHMTSMAGGMDQDMSMAGMPASADMTCVMSLMTQELQAHLGMACTLADLPADQAEAARHCAAMGLELDHQRMRAAELDGMIDGGAMGGGMSGGMMGDGGMTMDGGWTMPDGGMMGWDHAIPGCPAPAPAAP